MTDELVMLRQQNHELRSKIADLRTQLAQHENTLTKVLLTLDSRGVGVLRPGPDFDDTIGNALDAMFAATRKKLRIAIPYVTRGGLKEFYTVFAKALATPAEIHVMFRYPSPGEDLGIHADIHRTFELEIRTQKLQIRYLGSRGRSGLHAKTVIRDEEEAIVSSANWTAYSLSENAEVGLLTRSRRAVHQLNRWFDHCFEGAHTWKTVRQELGLS